MGIGMDTDRQITLVIRTSDSFLLSIGTSVLFSDLGDIGGDTVGLTNNVGFEVHFPSEHLSPFFGFRFGLEFVTKWHESYWIGDEWGWSSGGYDNETVLRFQPSIGAECFTNERFSVGGEIAPVLILDIGDDSSLSVESKIFVRWYF